MSKHPITDVIENDLIAEHNFCEASFNGMTEHARELEVLNAQLRQALVALCAWVDNTGVTRFPAFAGMNTEPLDNARNL